MKVKAAAVVKRGQPDELNRYLLESKAAIDEWRSAQQSRKVSVQRATPPNVVMARMAVLALERHLRAVLVGTPTGKLQLSRRDLTIAQWLFFTRNRGRRTVSTWLFHMVWRFVANKAGVMSLIQGMGIYCVFSRDLVKALTRLIDGRSCLEIGAGDGTLALLLEKSGTPTIAVDDQSWRHKVKYPQWVENIDAVSALRTYRPRVVICSWPPPGNEFERHVFACADVELYIVIGSAHRYASGNWATYEAQTLFHWGKDERLSGLVLPPELDNAVLVFERRTPSS